MNKIAKIIDNESPRLLEIYEHGSVFGAAEPTDEALQTHGYVRVLETPQPRSPYDLARTVAEVEGVWRIVWEPLPTANEIVTDRTEREKTRVRLRRDKFIQDMQWRYERYARETRLGVPPQDDIAALDVYVQALADIPQQPGFPWDVAWPDLP